ncbi:MAG TPA: isochorismatase family cysteine hydrolase [Caldilineaceae bacterium]|nr:isochorismatase family cysteine hydrolase [Caldilineaceae bacterium]
MDFQYLPGETVAVPEINYTPRLQLPAAKTAVIVVDMQNDFVTPGGKLVVPAAEATVPAIAQLLAAARAAGVRVAYTQDTHFEGDPEWQIWPEHCRQGTWGWEIVEALAPQPGDLVEQKSRYDGFYDTSLDHYLSRVWKVEHLVIVGTIASICVLHTAASAGLRWFHVVVPADGTSALTEFDQAVALRQVSWLYTGSVVRSVGDIEFVA